jgi:hypothetical protein
MKAEHRKELETNTLAQGASSLVDRIKTGRVGNYWIIAIVAAVVIVGGVWWYAAREGRKADAATWAAYVGVMRGPTNSEIDDFVKNNDKTTAAQLARLEQARMRLGLEGITLMRSDESAQRAKGVENVEKAREDLLKLAEEFKKDPSLRSAILLDAAEAELALAGVPKAKDASGTERRGSVQAAAQLYRDAAKTIGEATPAGEGLVKRAEEVEKKADEIVKLGEALYRPIHTPGFGGGTPFDPKAEGPKAPDKLDPKPEGPKVEGPKLPDKPLNPIPPPTPPTTTAPTGKAPEPAPGPTTPATKK